MTIGRDRNIERLKRESFDVLILGGGINGAGIARDLALRSSENHVTLRIALIEKNHFSSGTSGKNSQLIHGGLRYLKNLEFGLVRESLRERATLLRIAPHLVKPQPFLIPAYGKWSRWYFGAGLTLYDLLAGKRNIAPHRVLTRGDVEALEPMLARDDLHGGLLFYDCQVNSARLVLENIFDAARLGAVVANYVEASSIGAKQAEAVDHLSGETFAIRARQIVDATGAWSSGAPLRLVRGSHIVIPRIDNGDEAIAYFEDSGRVVFLIPWGGERQLTLVGTTDVDHAGSPDRVHISPDEIDYLTKTARRLFPQASIAEPISTYSSLRPLLRDDEASPTKTSREHRLWQSPDGVIHISGGKYTTYRSMSEETADAICRDVAPSLAGTCSTANTPLVERVGADPVAFAVTHEMAQHLSDILYVSTYWGYERLWTREELQPIARRMGSLLNWSEERIQQEIIDNCPQTR
ncbi:MAG: glycerol-3-phosphate dehydrogenase/oxidase [Acidobacteriota bacterium]|nr:glycerol-3-phosphate dehydrogenase/oxidase [Acidobacteriota bacterium]